MSQRAQNLMLIAICLIVDALSLGGLVAIGLSHEITGVDALMLAMSCLAMLGIFTLFLFFAIKATLAAAHGSEPAEPPQK